MYSVCADLSGRPGIMSWPLIIMGMALRLASRSRSDMPRSTIFWARLAMRRSAPPRPGWARLPIRWARLWRSWRADNLLWLRAGYHFHQVEPLRDITKIAPRPVLIIQSGKDSLVDPLDAARLYEAAGEPKELWTLPNADHCGAYFEGRTTYVRRIVNFFDLHLKNVPQIELVEPSTQQEIPIITDQGLSEAS